MAGKYLVTPVGEFEYPHILVADTRHKAEGLFHVKINLKDKEADTLQELIDNAHSNWKDKCLADNPNGKWKEWKPYKKLTDDSGMEVGTQFHFKLKASGVNSKNGQAFTQRPVVVGPDKSPLPNTLKVANGSIGKVAYELGPYLHGQTLGIQLRLRMVQVLKVIEYVPQANVDDVFGVEKDYDPIAEDTNVFTDEGEAFSSSEEKSGDF